MMDDISPVMALFAQAIPEIAAGTVEIKRIARKAGYRSKLALHSHDPNVDSVGVCVGVRGYRIKSIVDALGGERIDLVRWQDAPERFIVNALQPATIDAVRLYPAERRAVVVVKADQRSLVLGRRGENQQIAAELTGWQIDIEEV